MRKDWSRTARYVAFIAVFLALAWVLYAARPLLGPLVIAALLAYALYPAVTFIAARTRLGRDTSAAVVYALFLLLWAAALVALVPVVIGQVTRLSLELQGVRVQLDRLSADPVTIGGLDVPLGELLEDLDAVSSELLRPERLFRVFRAATSNLVWVLVILVATYYLLRDWEHLREWLIGLAPEAYQPDVRRLHAEIKGVWHAYLRGQLLLMLAVGVLTGVGSAAIGLPGAAALGLLAGVLEMIPSLGPAVTALVAAVVAWFDGSTFLPLSNLPFTVVVVALYVFVQLLENVWLQPRILGRVMRLNPGLVFVAVVGALALSGVLVALVIVPVLGTGFVLGRYVHRRVLGLEPWPELVRAQIQNGDSGAEEGPPDREERA